MKALALAAALALVLTACSAASGESPAVDGTTPADPTPTAASTLVPATDAPAPSSTDAADRLYPYALTWPAEELQNDWRYASAAWDGEARIDSGNQYTDIVRTSEGSLFAFGVPTDGTPEDLRDLVASQAAEWHGCDAEPVSAEELSGGGAPGIFGHYRCGSANVLRWVGVHDGFGLFIGHILGVTADVDDAAARFKAQIADIEWTN